MYYNPHCKSISVDCIDIHSIECIIFCTECHVCLDMHINYRPQRSWGKVIFSEACVKNSVHGGACMVARGHAWLPGGMHSCQGACMVAQGMCMVAVGGGGCVVARVCAWLPGGMCGCWGVCGCWGMCGCQGACMVAGGMHGCGEHACCGGTCMVGGCAWLQGGMHRTRRDTVNERAVRILLECILIFYIFYYVKAVDANLYKL